MFFFFLKNVSLLILYFLTNNSIIIKKIEIRNFYRNFHLLPQFHCNKHLKNTATFIATFLKSSGELRNFRPQLSKKMHAKSWGGLTDTIRTKPLSFASILFVSISHTPTQPHAQRDMI